MRPLFPQFGRACASFVAPTGFPRPFGALDWCPRCGQPDWAHQADGPGRVDLLDRLDDQRRSDMLRYLCEYSPATFDIILGAATAPGQCLDPAAEGVVEPFCVTCGAALTLSPGAAHRWLHYHDTPDGGRRLLRPGHAALLGWREPAG